MGSANFDVESVAGVLCEAMPDAVVLVAPDGRIQYANERVADLFGYDPGALTGEPVEILVPEGLRDDHVSHRQAYFDDPSTRPMGVGLSLTGQRKDGSVFPVEVSLSPVSIEGTAGVVAVVRDTTEREAIRTKYRAILETAPDAFFVADADTGELFEVNQRAVELTGYSEAELESMHQSDLHPSDGADRYQTLFEQHVESDGIRSELPDGSPIVIETSAGDRLPVEINARAFDLGERRFVSGAFRDITQRKERTQELERAETVIQATGDPVYMLDPDGHFAFVNEALARLTGYPEAELIGSHVSKVMPEDDIATAERLIRDLLDSPRERQTFEMTIHTAGGDQIPTENHIAIIQTDDGRLTASVGVVRDISERKARQRELERQNKRLDGFASVVAHDLRNPMTIADGRLTLAMEECDSEHLPAIKTALDRMDEIIDDTLTLARQGESVTETSPVILADVADRGWQSVETVRAELVVENGPPVQADRSRLQRLLENLIRNAIEHGGSTVTIGRRHDGFFVEDDGPGIPADKREKVFEVGESTSDDGAGLGLAIVNRIVEAHGWTIRVTDGEAGGARFVISTGERSE